MKRGKVYIVGAGPGNPELITLKAVRHIGDADVIVYDYLVNKEILRHAKRSIELIYAGKMHGEHSIPQTDINNILIDRAKKGYKVVRLKGGDPFLFGRGSEEALAISNAGIDFEIVAGVSSFSAVPLYSGIPLTHRDVSSSVVIITGHKHTHGSIEELNWDAIAKIDTIVILMGLTNIKEIAEKLIKSGRAPAEPVSLIRWGTLPTQSSSITSLIDLFETDTKPSSPPAVIVIGKVVEFHNHINWFEKLPLFGKKVLVTRAEKEGAYLKQSLEDLGALVIEQPTIKITEPDDYTILDKAISMLEKYDIIIFTSVNGVKYFIDRISYNHKDIRALANSSILAIGPKTAKAIQDLRLDVRGVPEEFNAEGLISMLGNSVKGKRILIPRAQEARMVLVDELNHKGAFVDVAPVYKTVKAEINYEFIPYLKDGVDLAIFTSSSTVKNFFEMFEQDAANIIKTSVIACIGPITAETAVKKGLKVSIQPSRYTIESLVEQIAQYFSKP